MPDVNFYLKKPNLNTGLSLIYLQFKYHNQRVVFSFKETIAPSDWNSKKQRVKSTIALTIDGRHLLNDLLENLQTICLNSYNLQKTKGIPLTQNIKKSLHDFLNYNLKEDEQKNAIPTIFDLIERFCSGEIKFKGRDKVKGTLQGYAATRKHLRDFSKAEAYPITYETIDLNFFISTQII